MVKYHHMFEADINQSYLEHSPKQIDSIAARYRKALEMVVERLKNNGLLWLDIGPNRGFGLKELRVNEDKVVAIDLEHQYLQEAISNNPQVSGAVIDGTKMGFPNSSFDVVTLFEVIEHMYEPPQRQLLREVGRVLKSDGLFVLSTPNKKASRGRRMSADHKREVTYEELASLLNEEGFEIIEYLGQGFFNNGLLHQLFRKARENPLMTLLYYKVLPWSLRSRFRDAIMDDQQMDQVRRPKPNEMERVIFVVCQKRAL